MKFRNVALFLALQTLLMAMEGGEAFCIQQKTTSSLKSLSSSSSKSRKSYQPTNSVKTTTTTTTALSVSNSPTRLSEATSSDDDKNKDVTEYEEPTVSRFRKLKDIMWVREALEDVTAAEFACSVEAATKGDEDEDGISNNNKKRNKRAVDYEKLLSQLERRITDMLCQPVFTEEEINGSSKSSSKSSSSSSSSSYPKVDQDRGMGRFAYTQEQRETLLKRILKTRKNLIEVIQGHNLDLQNNANDDDGGFGIKMPEMPDLNNIIPKEEEESSIASAGPKLYVRDDGTVDWEGALQDRAALRKFGGAVWARINGQTPTDIDEDDDEDSDAEDDKKSKGGKNGKNAKQKKSNAVAHQPKPAVTVKIEETPAIAEAREKLNKLQVALEALETSHTALLNSGIQLGQAVANVKLASLEPTLRSKIRQSADALEELEQKVSYQNLVYELERIYTYLAAELGNPANKGYIPLQDRLNVAEYGLLEGQVENCSRELNMKGVLDADILAVIEDQMIDFKRRLGIDYYVTGLTYDREAIQIWLNDLLRKTKNGLMFYVKGCRLFWNDLVYCSSLIARAAQGYTLKPREVRTIRRTFKDIITFIPVVIILIIPLSPVGHVLVFGAIQRFFPDFFPSCFTEQRQNLLQLYESTEFTEFTINETLRERFTRFLEAVAFSLASKTKSAIQVLATPRDEQQQQQQERLNGESSNNKDENDSSKR